MNYDPKDLAKKYLNQRKFDTEYIQTLRERKKDIEDEIVKVMSKPILKIIYKESYGDYEEYQESMLNEIKKLNNIDK